MSQPIANRGKSSAAVNKRTATNSSTTPEEISGKFKVRLRQARGSSFTRASEASQGNTYQKRGPANTEEVVFDVTPELTESRSVDYRTLTPMHLPGQMYVYGNSQSRTFSMSSIKLIARTMDEATRNMQMLWTLRGWTMPYFGQGSFWGRLGSYRDVQTSNQGSNNQRGPVGAGSLGRPPELLLLSAYANVPGGTAQGLRQFPTNIDNVPVLISNLTIPYPADVDYIPDKNGQPVPRVMMLDIQLLESRAPRELSQRFSIQEYRNGTLGGF